MDKGTGSCGAFAPDVLADILMRLPPNTRRRQWRHAVDTRTATDLRNRAKTIVVTRETAFIFDDLSTAGRPREMWTRAMAARFKGMSMVGTCNGLICLCDDRKRGGAITLVNPVTRGILSIPSLAPPYARGSLKWHRTYSFTYHPATGRYKIVHIPRNLDQALVFTLGEASWRDVPAVVRGARRDLDAGIVSADGYVYLAVEGTEARIMAFDLNHENFAFIGPLPNVLSRQGNWDLTEVQGRLGIAFTHVSQTLAKTEVWVMEGMAGQIKLNCWYILQVHKPRDQPYLQWHHRQYLAEPHFAHSGNHVLTRSRDNVLFRHMPSNDTRKARHGVVDISETKQGRVINNIGPGYSLYDYDATAALLR